MLSHDERLKLVMVDDGATREFTWKELFPSVFDRNAEFKPVFSCLGNEGGRDQIDIRWGRSPYVGDGFVAMITVCTADAEEQDIDEIEARTSWLWVFDHRSFRIAYRLARLIAGGGRLPPCYHPGVVDSVLDDVAINASRHHIVGAA